MVEMIQTIYGNIDADDMEKIKGYVKEITEHLTQIDDHKAAIKDILSQADEEVDVPKKIISKIAKTYHKNSFDSESTEMKEFEAIFEALFKKS